MEVGPGRGSDDGGDREPDSDAADRGSGADVEPEPVADVSGGGVTEVGFGGGEGDLAVEVDVEGAAGAEFACHERGCAFDDPVRVEQVEPFEQAVVGDVALKLRYGPAAGSRQGLQPVGQRAAERVRCGVAVCSRHGAACSPAWAWLIHLLLSGSPVSSRSHRRRLVPSSRRKP